MVADQPLVVYPNESKKKIDTKKKADDFYDRWKARKDATGGTLRKGEKISLGDYLRNGI